MGQQYQDIVSEEFLNAYTTTQFVCEGPTKITLFFNFVTEYIIQAPLLITVFMFSALYVVDLKKFRKIAAGDRLRGQYQGLSQDPNSLSNLDQVRVH